KRRSNRVVRSGITKTSENFRALTDDQCCLGSRETRIRFSLIGKSIGPLPLETGRPPIARSISGSFPRMEPRKPESRWNRSRETTASPSRRRAAAIESNSAITSPPTFGILWRSQTGSQRRRGIPRHNGGARLPRSRATRSLDFARDDGVAGFYLLSLIPSGISGGGALILLWLFP